LHENEK